MDGNHHQDTNNPDNKDHGDNRRENNRMPIRERQEIIDIFNQDMGTGIFILVLMVLGLIQAVMTRCTC